MEDNKFPVAQLGKEIEQHTFALPFLLLLATISTLSLSYGIAEKKWPLTLFSVIFLIGSLIVIILQERQDCHLSDQMLKVSEEELAEIENGLSLLEKPSPSRFWH